MVQNTLLSAKANAVTNQGLDPDRLRVGAWGGGLGAIAGLQLWVRLCVQCSCRWQRALVQAGSSGCQWRRREVLQAAVGSCAWQLQSF